MLLVALAAVNAAPVGEERHEEVPHKRDADDHPHKRDADDHPHKRTPIRTTKRAKMKKARTACPAPLRVSALIIQVIDFNF